jgi:hypothetical protein
MSQRFSWLRIAAALPVPFIAVACVSLAGKPAEEVVLQRAQARWDALVENDWAAAYQFMTPGYRAVVPQRRYGNQFRGPVVWESAKAKSATCAEARCTVVIQVNFRAMVPPHANQVSTTHFEETWVFEDGQWFKYEAI